MADMELDDDMLLFEADEDCCSPTEPNSQPEYMQESYGTATITTAQSQSLSFNDDYPLDLDFDLPSDEDTSGSSQFSSPWSDMISHTQEPNHEIVIKSEPDEHLFESSLRPLESQTGDGDDERNQRVDGYSLLFHSNESYK
jgi:hypothetical protein